ncbi:MAG: radical SAM protein [Bacteroidaceae bacterium]
MATVIYPAPIFGPIHSRRLGTSLGINLMPSDGKRCTFDCIYCECGYNAEHRTTRHHPTREEVYNALEARLQTMQEENAMPDVLTFAGNGEPTTHPDFAAILDDTIALRKRYCPEAKVSVLSNATLIHRPEVFNALKKVDQNILKLDTVNLPYIQRVNRPTGHYDLEKTIEQMKAFRRHIIIQTMFMKGESHGVSVDNTSDQFVLPWLQVVKQIEPQQVMIYTIDRETPDPGLRKATHEELDRIVRLIEAKGLKASASY